MTPVKLSGQRPPGRPPRARRPLPAMVIGAALALGLPAVASAQAVGEEDPGDDRVEERVRAVDGNHFLVGVAVDLHAGSTSALQDELIFGPVASYRVGRYSFGIRTGFDPVEVLRAINVGESEIERYRLLSGVHARVNFDLFGQHFLYGVGAQLEARIDDHFSLFYVTPVELGFVLFERGSHRVQLFAGVRVLAAGDLIDNFLIDPNGFDNEDAEEALAREESRRAEGFLGLAFVRRLD